jgi:hypothetical protein
LNRIEPIPWRGLRALDKILIVLLPLATAAVMLIPFVDRVLLRRLARLPGTRPILGWLASGYNAWIAGAGVLLLLLLYLFWVRRRFVGNKQLWFSAGCPQCMERELVRVSRKPADRLYRLLAIPAYRYACRNCTWRGLRVARREYSAERERELEEAMLRFQVDGLPVEQMGDEEDNRPTPSGSLFRDAGDVSWTDERLQAAPADEPLVESPVEEPDHHAESDNLQPVDDLEWIWQRTNDASPG